MHTYLPAGKFYGRLQVQTNIIQIPYVAEWVKDTFGSMLALVGGTSAAHLHIQSTCTAMRFQYYGIAACNYPARRNCQHR